MDIKFSLELRTLLALPDEEKAVILERRGVPHLTRRGTAPPNTPDADFADAPPILKLCGRGCSEYSRARTTLALRAKRAAGLVVALNRGKIQNQFDEKKNSSNVVRLQKTSIFPCANLRRGEPSTAFRKYKMFLTFPNFFSYSQIERL